MKILVFVKATANSEKGLPPIEDMKQIFADMGKFNEKLIKAGVLVDADGLKPSSAAKRVKFIDGSAPAVIDGPFAETKELVAGYWVWNVKSLDEALQWAKLCPNPMPGEEGVIELRPVYEAADFGGLISEPEQVKKRAKSKPKAKMKSTKRKPKKAKAKAKKK